MLSNDENWPEGVVVGKLPEHLESGFGRTSAISLYPSR